MRSTFEATFVSRLNRQLCDAEAARPFSLSRRAAAALLAAEKWPAKAALILPQLGSFSWQQGLELCQSTLEQLNAAPEEGWLEFTYSFALDLMFPQAGFCPHAVRYQDGALFLLALMQQVYTAERRAGLLDPSLDARMLADTEMSGQECEGEYRLLRRAIRREYVYETMRLSQELRPYRTLEHITGVHKVAMHAARQLREAGAPVDLCLISGAAIVHDIGKFGCKPGERVPYLHYYYTDCWCNQRGLPAIGHIGANHSVWDLELESLSVEALLLIYADFRAKQVWEEGRERTRIFTLDESFQVILDKLDNVDQAKVQRYRRVYAKLRDFEEYMSSLGVDLTLSKGRGAVDQREVALLTGSEAARRLKLLGVDHNIALMHHFSNERLFNNVLEAARSEKKWNNIRAYLGVFDEYFTYLNNNQKVQTLAFLYQLLSNREGDIRRQAATLMGSIIAKFEIGYKKELPADAERGGEPTSLTMWDKYIDLILYPDYKLTAQHKSWIGYTLKIMVTSFCQRCEAEARRPYLERLTACFQRTDPQQLEESVCFVLLDVLDALPLTYCDQEELCRLTAFARLAAGRDSLSLRAAALRALLHIAEYPASAGAERQAIAAFVSGFDCQDQVSLTFLRSRVLAACGWQGEEAQPPRCGGDLVSDVFLDNLKMATPWVVKAINIQLLLDEVNRDSHSPYLLHIAAHFSNLLKVSERVVVRHGAGAGLLEVAPLLSADQTNEIAVELTKGLEVGDYEFSKYIPDYLGRFALYLRPAELDELIYQLNALVSSPNTSVVAVAMSTIGVLLEGYGDYGLTFGEEPEKSQRRADRLLGVLLKGLVGHRSAVRQEALLVIGQRIFASHRLPPSSKRRILGKCCKKLLALLEENREGGLAFFYRAAALNHIYRFISDSLLEQGEFPVEQPRRAAFFPGTFDPFSLSHKGIVEAICDLDFEVLLAIDEFSWSKKTQPHRIRRQIAEMSLADRFHVHIYPDSLPVNIANPADLARLRASLPGRQVFMVAGSDVVANASAYRSQPRAGSIHSFDHIIFRRASMEDSGQYPGLLGKVIQLQLPLELEDVSSSRIRDNIDNDRDIANLIDPMAQEFIYHYNLYLREPQYKTVQESGGLCVVRQDGQERQALQNLLQQLQPEQAENNQSLAAQLSQPGCTLVMLQEDDLPLALLTRHILPADDLLSLLESPTLTDRVRRQQPSRVMLISSVFLRRGGDRGALAQTLLTEALEDALQQGCTHALFYPLDNSSQEATLAVMERQGFQLLPGLEGRRPLYIVDMRDQLVLICNIETTLKQPFATAPAILEAARKAHYRLQSAMANLRPGRLVLSLDADLIHQRLIRRITERNGVPAIPTQPRTLGPLMCVPFGKLLRGSVVPNTVTKTLHTDKVFEPDIRSFLVEAYPNYSPLKDQISVIRSFDRPVIMVDDLLHSGHRMRTVSPLLEAGGVDVDCVMVGVLSSRGRDLMQVQGHRSEGVYYVPNLQGWCVESTVYPFIGGDTVRRPGRPVANLLPSVNLILPYASIRIYNQFPREAVFRYSLACLENARDMMLALEKEYLTRFGRNLTLNRLSEVVILPVAPDKGHRMGYDYNQLASSYVRTDLELLLRMENLFLPEV